MEGSPASPPSRSSDGGDLRDLGVARSVEAAALQERLIRERLSTLGDGHARRSEDGAGPSGRGDRLEAIEHEIRTVQELLEEESIIAHKLACSCDQYNIFVNFCTG